MYVRKEPETVTEDVASVKEGNAEAEQAELTENLRDHGDRQLEQVKKGGDYQPIVRACGQLSRFLGQ